MQQLTLFQSILIIFSFFALTFGFKESYLTNGLRVFLIRLHPFFYHLFNCFLCIGCHVGWILYLIVTPTNLYSIKEIIIWALGSGGISYFLNAITAYFLSDSGETH